MLLLAKVFSLGKVDLNGEKYAFLTIDLSIDDKTTIEGLAQKICVGLEREVKSNEKLLSVVKGFWQFLQRVETSVLKIRPSECGITSDTFIDRLTFSLVDTIKAVTQDSSPLDLHCKKDGLVILIDEADKAPRGLNLGGFLKRLTEKLVAEDCNRIVFILAGLPRLSELLHASHNSSLRLFEELFLAPLSKDEVNTVIGRGVTEAKEKNKTDIIVDDGALDLIMVYSEGYPHFVQQIAYSTYEYDSDNHITRQDVEDAMFMRKGALELIGNRYYRDLYYTKIREEQYRKILQIIAERWNDWITKDEIKRKFRGSSTTLTNGLHTLVKRNIILAKQGARGVYRLQWASFAFWINMSAARQKGP